MKNTIKICLILITFLVGIVFIINKQSSKDNNYSKEEIIKINDYHSRLRAAYYDWNNADMKYLTKAEDFATNYKVKLEDIYKADAAISYLLVNGFEEKLPDVYFDGTRVSAKQSFRLFSSLYDNISKTVLKEITKSKIKVRSNKSLYNESDIYSEIFDSYNYNSNKHLFNSKKDEIVAKLTILEERLLKNFQNNDIKMLSTDKATIDSIAKISIELFTIEQLDNNLDKITKKFLKSQELLFGEQISYIKDTELDNYDKKYAEFMNDRSIEKYLEESESIQEYKSALPERTIKRLAENKKKEESKEEPIVKTEKVEIQIENKPEIKYMGSITRSDWGLLIFPVGKYKIDLDFDNKLDTLTYGIEGNSLVLRVKSSRSNKEYDLLKLVKNFWISPNLKKFKPEQCVLYMMDSPFGKGIFLLVIDDDKRVAWMAVWLYDFVLGEYNKEISRFEKMEYREAFLGRKEIESSAVNALKVAK